MEIHRLWGRQAVRRHEDFEALCGAASIGQASGAELAELQQHFAECSACQQSYAEFLQLSAVQCASNTLEQEISRDEAIGYIDSALFREKFFKKAEEEGIVFSQGTAASNVAERRSPSIQVRNWRISFAFAIAATIFLACATVCGYYYGARRLQKVSQAGIIASTPVAASQKEASVPNSETTIIRLQNTNRLLTDEIQSLKASLHDAVTSLDNQEANSATFENERASLLEAGKQREAFISNLEQQLEQAQTEVASVRSEINKTQEGNQATAVAEEVKLRELSDQLAEQSTSLEREKQMLAVTRDIRDLMAARNLHIADVFDTDPKGKTRPAFGRIFFTEGKSLIFYAYDLNDRRVEDAGYNYRVWGRKEGPNQSAKSLGIFFSDDKAQKRWVFKCDDPRILSEIDSVFVTLEPPKSNPNQPEGQKLLYAYLRNQANHP
jgi:hypothetical protein